MNFCTYIRKINYDNIDSDSTDWLIDLTLFKEGKHMTVSAKTLIT
jgi:hypothetical protein